MDARNPVKLTAPAADLDALSFSASDAGAVADWTASLPMANTQLCATELLKATQEMARLRCSSNTRLELLEILRPTLQYICTRLDRGPGSGTEPGGSMTELAQHLQTNLTAGYKAVIRDADPGRSADRDSIALACHRTVADLSRTLLRSCQHYIAPGHNLWLELNQLYAMAEQLKFADARIQDDENHSVLDMSIASHYMRALLLATAKPNQLRHRQLSSIFNALENWSGFVKITASAENSLFCVNLGSDEPPCYTRLIGGDLAAPNLRGFSPLELVNELEAFLKQSETRAAMPDYITEPGIINHLVNCWGEIAKRGFRRAPASGLMKLAVGMPAAHYFLSGGIDFDQQLGSPEARLKMEINPFLKAPTTTNPTAASPDVWDRRIPENPNVLDPTKILLKDEAEAAADSAAAAPVFRAFDARILDTSPGGYRLQWSGDGPKGLQTGDIMAIREAEDQNWCIAVLRWVQHDNGVTQTGLELIAPRAIPVAIRVIQKKGGPRDYARSLLLPELAAIRQPATLITPTLQFKEGQKINLQRDGVTATAQLASERLRTESFTQFTFRMLDGYLENSRIDLNMVADWNSPDTAGDSPITAS